MSKSPAFAENVPRAAIVCLPCKTRKRRCDKRLPRCSNCDRVQRACRYDCDESRSAARSTWTITLLNRPSENSRSRGCENTPFQASTSLFPELQRTSHSNRPAKAPVTVCERCRSQKRACDKAWPSCSRCAKHRVACIYGPGCAVVNKFTSLSTQSQCGPIERFWAGIVDPFQTNPLSFPPDLVNHCNVYRISVLAPCLTPRSSDVPEVPIVQYWFSPTYNDATLFVTTLLCVLSHQRRRWILMGQTADGSFRPQDVRWLDWCYVEGIRQINRALSNKESAITDNMILNVLIMAAADGGTVSMDALDSPFHPPLRSLQWLDIYGSVSTSPVHLRGLIQLIHLRGGLEMIQLPGLGAVLCFFELINCTKALSHPQFSFISLQGIKHPTLSEFFAFNTGFLKDRFVELYRVGCSEEFLAIFQAMRVHIFTLDRYMRGMIVDPDLRQISDHRNLIQHRLMSLRPASGREASQINLSEACRLSAIIFSVGVIFPLSGHEAPFSSLANMLRVELEACDATARLLEPEHTTILLWILTLGGLAATQADLRAWFVNKLGNIALNTTNRWTEVKERLQAMLWLDAACDCAGERLWKEVESLKSPSLRHGSADVSQAK